MTAPRQADWGRTDSCGTQWRRTDERMTDERTTDERRTD
jgi:hypothetical protein